MRLRQLARIFRMSIKCDARVPRVWIFRPGKATNPSCFLSERAWAFRPTNTAQTKSPGSSPGINENNLTVTSNEAQNGQESRSTRRR